MTAVAQELTCPHERREIPDRDHNKRSFLAFSLFFHPHGTLANKQQSLILVTLYHAGIFHWSKRREMANDEDFFICAVCVLRRNTGGRSPPSIPHKELGYFQYTRTVYSMVAAILPEIRFIQWMNS